MTEVIHDTDSTNTGLMVVILVVVIAIGGFLIWRFSANQTNDNGSGINLNIGTNGSSTGN